MNGQFNFGEINPLKYFLSLSIGLGVLFAFISSGDDEPRTWMTFVQWQLQTVIPVLILIQCHCLVVQKTPLGRASLIWQFVVSGLLGATLFSPIALGIDWFFEGDLEEPTFLAALVDEWGGVTFPVTVSWMLMNIPLIGGLTINKAKRLETFKETASEEIDVTPSPNFLSLCEQQDITQIEALQAELHYISVITPEKSELILYSLKDAIEELPASLGWRVHRSCWVAFAHLEEIKPQGRQGLAVSMSGNTYPVSRSQYPSFQAAWQAFKAEL